VPAYNQDHKVVLDELLLGDPRVRPGKMFGYPAYYAGEKLAICLYEESVGLKVPEGLAERLVAEDPNVVSFQPLGRRRMREWVQISLEVSGNYQNYQSIFEESIRFVLSLQGEQ
jgi:hypothetical protein